MGFLHIRWTPKALTNQADKPSPESVPKPSSKYLSEPCVVCKKQRDYKLTPIAFLEDNPERNGGVCRELYIDGKTCYMIYEEMLYRQSPDNPRNKYPTGRPPTETEKLTVAIKELTQELATRRTKAKKPRKTHTKSAPVQNAGELDS